jgi:uracil-DNA glycosylase
MDRLDLYSAITGCPLMCSDIIRDGNSNIPRGFYTEAQLGDPIDLMVVGINPGQAMDSEQGIYSGLSPRKQATTHLDFAGLSFEPPYGKTFFKRLAKWLSYVLGVSEKAVFKRVVYTNMVKCSTPHNKRPIWETRLTCYQHHLSREIDVWKPRMVVALGPECGKYLASLGIKFEFLPHPSHREHAEYHVPFCEALRSKLRECV